MRDAPFSRRRFVLLSGTTMIAVGGYSFGSRSGLARLGVFLGEPRISLSSFSVSEQIQPGSVVGSISVIAGSGAYTFAIPSGGDPDAKFSVDGATLLTKDTFDFENATFHRLTIEASNGIDPKLSRTLLINVTNAFEKPDLGPLILPDTLALGSVVAIIGATEGSTITAVSLPEGWTFDNENLQVLISTDAALGEHNWSFIETLSDSRNSPNVSNGSSMVQAAPVTPFDPVAQGFVVFDSRDISADGAVSTWQSKSKRNTVSNANILEQPSKGTGVVSFDGSDDILTDRTRGFGVPRSINLDTVWNSDPLGDSEQFTNTGIDRAPDGTWWLVNHPAGAPSRRDGILVHFNADFTAVIEKLDLGSIYGTGIIGGPQGLVYDTDDDTLWFTNSLQNLVRHIALDGTPLTGDDVPFTNPAGLAIDQANGTLIILESEGSASNKSAGVLQTINKASKALVGSGRLRVQPDWDQMYFDQDSRALFITSGYAYQGNGQDTFVGIYSMDETAYIEQIALVPIPDSAHAIEGIVCHDGKLYINNDSGFHSREGIGSLINEVLVYDVGQIVGSKIAFFGAFSVDGSTNTDGVVSLGNSTGARGHSFFVNGTTQLRLHNRIDNGVSFYNANFTVPDLRTRRIVYCEYDRVANSARMWVDGTEVPLATGGLTEVGRITGPIVDRMPLALSGVVNGNRKERHASIDVSALGYAILQSGANENRQETEGWLAHEFGLTAALPENHPYRTFAPST